MPENYIPPQQDRDAFNCPHCEAFAHQSWQNISWTHGVSESNIYGGKISRCSHCSEYGIWIEGQLVYPVQSPAPLPAEDMPENVEKHYREARNILNESPRASAALLRLAMEELSEELGADEDQTLYQNIGDLLDEGKIDERMQQALDSVRIIGNDYVHAGEITDGDDAETALNLFTLVNTIVETTITRERLIEESYSDVPENKLEGIRQRDEN